MPHVTFIHGISNQPPVDDLLKAWRGTLADSGLGLGARGVSSSMVYWADLLYPRPRSELGYEAADEELGADAVPDVGLLWAAGARGEEAELIARLARSIGYGELADAATPLDSEDVPIADEAAATSFERVPIPWFLKRRLMRILLRDVHHYLFNTTFSPRSGEEYEIQSEIRQRTVAALCDGASRGGPHVVVAHSLGSVIAYDCLKRVSGCPAVDGLMTVGSPLGLDEVQDRLRPEWSRNDGFPDAAVRRWVNVFDRLDPVAGLDANLANDFRHDRAAAVEDVHEPNGGVWRHSIVKYLRGPQLRHRLADMLDVLPR